MIAGDRGEDGFNAGLRYRKAEITRISDFEPGQQMNNVQPLNSSASEPSNRGRAFLVGRSSSGLLAARALSGHFLEVRILERDPTARRRDTEPRSAAKSASARLVAARSRDHRKLLPRNRRRTPMPRSDAARYRNHVAWLTSQGWSIKFTVAGFLGLLGERPARLVRESRRRGGSAGVWSVP